MKRRQLRMVGLAALAGSVLFATAASGAAAQSDADLERARAAFGEGVELSEQGRWDEAAERFREVMEVRATGQVKYNLAVALEHTGGLAEAATLLRDVVDDSEVPRRTRRDAQRLLESIEPRLGRLTVDVVGSHSGVRVTVDGRELPAHDFGRGIVADPGTRVVVLERGGRELDRQTATIPEGGSASVTLDASTVPTPAEVALDSEIAGPPAEASGESDSVLGEWWLWAGIGAVVLGVVLIAVIASSGGDDPVQGNLNPPIIEVMP